MDKLFKVGAVLCTLLMAHGFAADDSMSTTQDTTSNTGSSSGYGYYPRDTNANNYSANNYAGNGAGACAQGACAPAAAPADHPCGDVKTGDCWCMYCHYEPCTYYTQRCVEEQIPCKKRCCRQVPKYYQVQRCKMVPEYYNETLCKYETEYYYVDDSKCCKKWVSDSHVKYVPKYYWKHTCGEANCTTACPQQQPAGN